MHLWRSEYGPFIRYLQRLLCRRLIVVPLTTFHRLAEQIGDPQGELIFVFNTTRCGSTLLAQVNNKTNDNGIIIKIFSLYCAWCKEPISRFFVIINAVQRIAGSFMTFFYIKWRTR